MYTPSSWLIWGRFHRKLDESGLSGESMGPRISYCGLECWAKTSWLCWELCFQSKASAGAGRPKRIRTETYYVYYIYNYIYIVICNMYTYTTIYNMYTYKYIYIYISTRIYNMYIYIVYIRTEYTQTCIYTEIFLSLQVYIWWFPDLSAAIHDVRDGFLHLMCQLKNYRPRWDLSHAERPRSFSLSLSKQCRWMCPMPGQFLSQVLGVCLPGKVSPTKGGFLLSLFVGHWRHKAPWPWRRKAVGVGRWGPRGSLIHESVVISWTAFEV